jgi:acyl carrier protein
MRDQRKIPDLQTVRSEVRDFILATFIPTGNGAGLRDDDLLFESAIIDSAGAMTFIVHLETFYGIEILDEELFPENFASVDHIMRFLEGKLNGRGKPGLMGAENETITHRPGDNSQVPAGRRA